MPTESISWIPCLFPDKSAKRQKQKDLKVQAILAQVRKMAKEDGFDFATEVDSIKLKLIIRLSDQDYFAILIPFNQFKEVLPKLRTAIQALRETYNSGVRFKTHLKRGYRRSDWIRQFEIELHQRCRPHCANRSAAHPWTPSSPRHRFDR